MAQPAVPREFPHLVKVDYAYHVTNVEATGEESVPPQWKILEASLVDDKVFDGPLVGLMGVFLMTSVSDGDPPTVSSYPRKGSEGTSYWRLLYPLENFNEYDMSYCQTTKPEQVRIVLTHTASTSKVRQHPAITALDSFNRYLCRKPSMKSKTMKWYTNDYNETGYYTNIFLIGDLPIYGKFKWDKVKRNEHGPGCPLNRKARMAIQNDLWFTDASKRKRKITAEQPNESDVDK